MEAHLDALNTHGYLPSQLRQSMEGVMEVRGILAIIFASLAVIGVLGGALNRFQLRKAIGAQFIRYNAMVVALPVAASLAVIGMLTEAAVTVLLGSLGYAFASGTRDEK